MLVINGATFAVEMGAGLAAGSASLQADALDFLGDAGNYAISLFAVGMALRYRAMAALAKAVTMPRPVLLKQSAEVGIRGAGHHLTAHRSIGGASNVMAFWLAGRPHFSAIELLALGVVLSATASAGDARTSDARRRLKGSPWQAYVGQPLLRRAAPS